MEENKQRKILGWLLADRVLYLQTAQFLEPEFFTDPKCKKTLEYITSFVKEHKQLPTEAIIETELGFNPATEFSETEPSELEKDYIITSLEEFYKESTFKNFLLNGVDMIDKGTIDYGALERSMKEIVTTSMKVDIGMDFFKDAMARYESLEDGKNSIPIGFPHMDKLLGGWERSEFHLIGGATGAGKSIFLTNFSVKNVLSGCNVLTISLELSEKMFGLRYDTILLNRHKDIVIANKKKNSQKLLMLEEASGGSLTIKYFPTASLTTNLLEAYIEQYFLINGFYPDIIYIDYMSLMRPNGKYAVENSYKQEKDISEELRGLSGQLDIPVISATQLNRAGVDSAVPDKNVVSDSFGKIFTAGTLLNISQTKAEKQMGLTKLYCAKSRNNADGWMSNFSLCYNTLKLEEVGYNMHAGTGEPEKDTTGYEGVK